MDWTKEIAGPFVAFAQEAFEAFGTAVVSVDDDCLLFRGAYSHSRKMAGLAVLSALRQHQVENAINLRQVIEGTCLFGYLGANPGIPKSLSKAGAQPHEFVVGQERLRKAAFDWTTATYPDLDADLRHYKNWINRNKSHVTVLNTAAVFDYREPDISDERFFDVEDEHETRTMLLLTGNVTTLAIVMLQRVAKTSGLIRVQPNIVDVVNDLFSQASRLRELSLASRDEAGR